MGSCGRHFKMSVRHLARVPEAAKWLMREQELANQEQGLEGTKEGGDVDE